MRTKKEDKERLRETILREAVPFLKRWGKDNAPVDKIMSQAGVTSGALYSHFKSKDGLFAEAVSYELGRIRKVYADMIAEHGKGAASLRAVVDWYLQPLHIDAVEQGCIFAALGPDIQRSEAAHAEQLAAIFETLGDAFEDTDAAVRLTKAKILVSSMLGALLLARTMKDKAAAASVIEAMKAQVLSLASSRA